MPHVKTFLAKAEFLGYDSLWVQEKIIGDFAMLEPVALLCYAAGLTSRIWFAVRYDNADLAVRVSIWGGTEQCIEELWRIVNAGAKHLVFNPVFDKLEHLELLAEDSIPQL